MKGSNDRRKNTSCIAGLKLVQKSVQIKGGGDLMTEQKEFIEPELIKYEESLDEVTLQHNTYNGKDKGKGW